jgi:hypothetical protein
LPVKLIIVVTTAISGYAQDTAMWPNLIDCIYPPAEDYVKTSVSPNYDFYYDPDTGIPYCTSEPLKMPSYLVGCECVEVPVDPAGLRDNFSSRIFF